ncbi:MAG: primosomal protein N' [Erysipelotrichaceae bacterium]|nr:primosomal protein N' [Erysipelotrichaceae bacterium]
MYLIEVYVTNASLNVDRPFTYYSEVPVTRFCRVKVEFHHAPNHAIVSGCRHTDKNLQEIKKELGFEPLPVLEVIDSEPVLSQELFDLAFWLSRTTVSPLISCLNAMLPKTLKTDRNIKNPKMVRKIRKNPGEFDLTEKQRNVYELITDDMSLTDANRISISIVKKLLDKGAISEYVSEAEYENQPISPASFKQLTPDQQKAYDTIIETDKTVSLLFGVTGSGKTEVYLHLARHYLKQDKDVLILVPEISLTPQMIQRVKERFEDVVFYHSELSDQERYEQYKRVKQGEVRIVVGTRSAIFLPFKKLGMIIIDEEHDQSYKQDNVPCYQVKNVAFKRALTHQAKVLLASATPSLESYTRALKGDYEFLQLQNRINLNLPVIKVIDLARQIRQRDSYIISKPLDEAIRQTLEQSKQVIILLNRRGYSPIIKCSECNTTLMCTDCDTPLNYHKDENVLKCHQCGKTYRIPKICPNCGKDSLIYYGFGTKRVEEELHHRYPQARIERMDRDNVERKGAHENILKRFERHETDILIGTQMIAKGLDYPDVTLVGILNADAGLMHQDYNSAKMTFDLLMQASGRSGRADTKGQVIIQAFNTEHYAIKAVMNQNYSYFYRIEMNYREKTGYPPYSHIVELIVSDTNETRLNTSAELLDEEIGRLKYKKYRLYEMAKIKKQFRKRILIMDKDLIGMLKDLHQIIDKYLKKNNLSRIKVDIDPLYLE